MRKTAGLYHKSFYQKYKNEISAYSMLLIPLLVWGVFNIYAFVRTVFMSFTDWSFVSQTFIGLENYFEAFKDTQFLVGLKNTFIFTVVILIGVNVIGLAIAVALNAIKNKFVQKAFLLLLFWPCLVSAAVSAELQRYIFNSMSFGLMNTILMNLNLISAPLGWIDDPNLALISIMIIPFFFGFGIKMIIYYVGVKGLPRSYYEAASLDTTNKWTVFWKITMPMLKPIIFLNVTMSIIEGLKVIAPMQLISFGGPDDATMSISLKMYNEAFMSYRFGYASAIAVILFVIVLVITVVQFKFKGESASNE